MSLPFRCACPRPNKASSHGARKYPEVRSSSPAVSTNGNIYIQTGAPAIGLETKHGELVAFDPDGKQLWSLDTSDYAGSSPSIGPDGTIYIGAGSKLLAVNPDGSVRWQASINGGVYAPAIGPDGTIYVTSPDFNIHAFAPDGTPKWSYPTGWVTTPSVAIAADGTIYAGSADLYLYVLNPDGTIKWTFRTGPFPGNPSVGQDGTVYVAIGNVAGGIIYALNSDGTSRWAFSSPASIITVPLVRTDGSVYFGCGDGRVFAIGPNGEEKWEFLADSAITATPALRADGSLLLISQSGRLYILDDNGKPQLTLDIGAPVSSSPTIAPDGKIYIGSDDGALHLFLDSAAPASGWPMFGTTATHRYIDSTTALPDAPAHLRTRVSPSGWLSLQWDPSPTPVTYEIWRASTNRVADATLLTQFNSGTSWEDTTLSKGLTYYYWVRARNSLGSGPFSDPLTASLPFPPVGQIIWKYPIHDGTQNGAAAIGDDGTIYFGGTNLHAFDPAGFLKWKTPVEGILVGTPVVALDGTIYGGSTADYLYAFAPDGTIKWKAQGIETPDQPSVVPELTVSPALGPDGTIYIGGNESLFYAFAPDSTLKWPYWLGAGNFMGSPAAIASDGTTYFSGGGQLYALRPSGDVQWARGGAWLYAAAIGSHGGIYAVNDSGIQAIRPDGSQLWSFAPAAGTGASPAIGPDGTVYCGAANSNFFALSPAGQLKWLFPAAGAITTSPSIAADGTIYFGGTDQNLYAIDSNGNLRWKLPLGGALQSSPTIGQNGSIYVGANDGYLYFVRGDSPLADSPWPTLQQNNHRTGLSPIPIQQASPPPGISATKGTLFGTIRVQWSSTDWAAAYDVLRSTNSDLATGTVISTNLSDTIFFDLSATPGQQYFYWVRATNSKGPSLWAGPDYGYFNSPLPGDDDRWAREFCLPGNGASRIQDMTLCLSLERSGDLIAAGGFRDMAGVPGTYGIARWDREVWSSLGGGLGVGSTIYSLIADGTNIYIGGAFVNVGGQRITNVAQWDGTRWHSLGDGLSGGDVRALALWNGKLFAGGTFRTSGAATVNYFAQWDGHGIFPNGCKWLGIKTFTILIDIWRWKAQFRLG